MTNFLSPGGFNDAQDPAQLGRLDEIIKDLTLVYNHKIGRIRSTEQTELARGQLYTCIQNLMGERESRVKRAKNAAKQVQSQAYTNRLLEQSADYYDVEIMPDVEY